MESIRQRRQALGMTQKDLAQKVRVCQSTIAQIETGAQKPSLPVLTWIARALGCKLDDLIDEEARA